MIRKILYAGSLGRGATSRYRFHALKRLGHEVIAFDVESRSAKSFLLSRLQIRFPVGPLIERINRELLQKVQQHSPELVWFDKPIFFNAETIRSIRRAGIYTVCYNQDNPFGPRNDPGWLQFRRTFGLFDLHCLVRNADVVRYRAMGLNAVKTQFSFDPVQQYPPHGGWSDMDRNREISYVGSPFEDRPQFLRTLIEQHLPVTLSGPRWNRHLSREEMRSWVRGGMLREEEYREAIWRSRINLAFVTHHNEDDVAHKAFEITASGGFLLAERTPGHQAVFEEGKEAEFFSSVEECVEKCSYYLAHPLAREIIARRGCERAWSSGYDNDFQLSQILACIPETGSRAASCEVVVG